MYLCVGPEENKSIEWCKTDIKIVRPDMAIMFDEVGCNLSQEGDNVNGGEKFMCGPDDCLSIITFSAHIWVANDCLHSPY